jgi:hypothetical protein
MSDRRYVIDGSRDVDGHHCQYAGNVGVGRSDRRTRGRGSEMKLASRDARHNSSAFVLTVDEVALGLLVDPENSARYDSQTADTVALAMEYPWA